MQIEILLDATIDQARELMSPIGNDQKVHIPMSRLVKVTRAREAVSAASEVSYKGHIIRELETGSIEVELNGEIISPAKPKLREFAADLAIGLLNSNGNKRNTRQLGSLIIQAILEQGKA